MATQLYDQQGQKLFPTIEDTDRTIKSHAFSGKDTIETALRYVEQIAKTAQEGVDELNGSSEAVQSISITAQYILSTSSDKTVIESLEDWSPDFQFPDTDKPYAWKKTIFETKGGTTTTTYEIVASDNTKETQTIYLATDNTSVITIPYPNQKDEEGNDIEDTEDLTAYDDKLPDGWLETPQSISASQPYLYMSVRKKGEDEIGKWGRYSSPALLGKWAFDSKLETLYRVVESGTATVVRRDPTPSGWGVAPTGDFTGKLYMITSSSINGVPTTDKDGNIWSNPILLAVVK